MSEELAEVDFQRFWRRLQQLGLNAYESRSYLVLLGHPKFKALELAARAHVPRQKIYEVLDSLENEIPIVLASFGQGSNSIKSAEQGAGLGLPIAKSLIDMHGGTFTLKSKLRIGTEVIITFPPERVMSALGAMSDEATPLQPEPTNQSTPDEKRLVRRKPIMNAGTGL